MRSALPRAHCGQRSRWTFVVLLMQTACVIDPADLLGGESLVASSRVDQSGPQIDAPPLAERIAPDGRYRVFDLGPARAGETWSIEHGTDAAEGSYAIAVFDNEMSLILRQSARRGGTLVHTMRRDTPNLQFAVAGDNDVIGAVGVSARRSLELSAPAPQGQIVYLDFRGSDDVLIAGSRQPAFAPFDAASLGPAYVNQTPTIKLGILQTLQAHYGAYQIEFITSDDAPPPSQPHSTLHFGGRHTSLLGAADAVDRYNERPDDRAIIYVEAFARYATMQLSPEQMGQMIGNTAGHELGHLLGLYHAAGATSLMDTRGTAWEYAGTRQPVAAVLEPDVFPIGMDNAPLILRETLGLRADPLAIAARTASARQASPYHRALRALHAAHDCNCGQAQLAPSAPGKP